MYQPNNFSYYPSNTNIQQPRSMQVIPQGLKGRFVSSIEEARVAGIDFDGSIFYFPDIANKRIYTKQINPDGTPSLMMYEPVKIPVDPVQNNNYITREEFEQVIKELRAGGSPNGAATPQQPQAPAPAVTQTTQQSFDF